MGETGYIVFYVVFFGLITLIGSFTGSPVDTSGEDITNVPTFDGGVVDALLLPFQWIGYIVGLQGLTVFGVSGVASAVFSMLFNVPLIYVVARLARGGG